MNAYIFAALPIVALAAVAFLGLRWLRQPVDNEQKAATASDAPKITSLLQNVAESAKRIVETNSELALVLTNQPHRATRPAVSQGASPRASAAWKAAAKPVMAKKPAAKPAAAKKPAAKPAAARKPAGKVAASKPAAAGR